MKKKTPTLDDRQKLAEIRRLNREAAHLSAEIKEANARILAEDARLKVLEACNKIEQIDCLRRLLEGACISEEAPVLQEHPIFLPAFDLADQDKIRAKIFQIIAGM